MRRIDRHRDKAHACTFQRPQSAQNLHDVLAAICVLVIGEALEI
ncbi:MAG: hypothetical protein U0694_08260 [Anaerolineae bacterium]